MAFRPDTYWPNALTLEQLLAGIRWKTRQDIARRLYAEKGFPALSEFLVKPGLDEHERDDWILRGPSCMGGEFLPALAPEHIEIARVSMASTTSDQFSIRRLREVDHIPYSIVGEYEDEEGMSYDLPFETSNAPLSMQELLAFMDGATYQNDLYPSGTLSSSWFMMHEFGHDDVAGVNEFLSLSSPFYPSINACYLQLAADWLAG
jgi:hypothetical protein